MIIAAAQTLITPGIAANGRSIRAQIEEAAGRGARLVHFSEGALSGYAKSQIGDWEAVEWGVLRTELDAIAACCARFGVYAVIGSAHPLGGGERPHNSLYVVSDSGALVTRYDKRFLSHTEINDWYTPGGAPVVFSVDGFRFGCAICIEIAFPTVFAEYEALDVDCVLFSSYGCGDIAQVQSRAHAATNCVWFSVSVPAQCAESGRSGVIGPDGRWLAQATALPQADLALADMDRAAPSLDVALNKARPWRRRAQAGDIYTARATQHPRSVGRTQF